MESRVGWNRVAQAARFAQVTVLCNQGPSTEEIQKHLPNDCVVPKFHSVPLTPWQKRLLRLPFAYFSAYHLWQKNAFEVAQELHASQPFDLAHQVNLCSFREPGYLSNLGIPFVWGPWAGTQNFPIRFLPHVDLPGGISELIRNIANCYQFRRSKRFRRALLNSYPIVVHREAQRDVLRIHKVQTDTQIEMGTTAVDPKTKEFPTGRPLRILWAGRLRTWKALPLLLHALAKLPKEFNFELKVMGQGKCETKWKQLATKLKIDSKITWIGWPKYLDTLPHYEWADIFAFTSLRDTSGTGLFEAMDCGTPIVCVDHQGVKDVVSDDCAIRIPVNNPKQAIDGFCTAIRQLSQSPEIYKQKSQGACDRARQIHWDQLGAQMMAIYERVLKKSIRSKASATSAAPAKGRFAFRGFRRKTTGIRHLIS